jgi:hypothetical protein
MGADLWPGSGIRHVGLGRVAVGPWEDASFAAIGIEPDFMVTDEGDDPEPPAMRRIAWTHRSDDGVEIYFISNQDNSPRRFEVSLRVSGREPEIWDPVTRDIRQAGTWRVESGRTILPLSLPACGSVFVVLRTPFAGTKGAGAANWDEPAVAATVGGPWTVSFNPASGGPSAPVVFPELSSWSKMEEPGVRYYSGTATYSLKFNWTAAPSGASRVWLDLGRVANLADITLNGIDCGVAWTAPYKVDVTAALHPGENQLSIAVTNTWANRLIGDHGLPPEKQITFMRAPYRLDGRPLLEAGLLGPVTLLSQ